MISLTVAPPGKLSAVDLGSVANVWSIWALAAKYEVGWGVVAPPAPTPRAGGRGAKTRSATYSKRAEGSMSYAILRGTYTTSPAATSYGALVARGTFAAPFRTNQYSSASGWL